MPGILKPSLPAFPPVVAWITLVHPFTNAVGLIEILKVYTLGTLGTTLMTLLFFVLIVAKLKMKFPGLTTFAPVAKVKRKNEDLKIIPTENLLHLT